MCGRYSLQRTLENLKNRYGVSTEQVSFSPRPEIFPSNEAPVVIAPGEENRQLKLFHWGFSPSFASTLIINARGETIEKKATFKKSFYNKRCLVPADAFFEWKNTGDGKVKYKISLKNRPLLSMAGIYDTFKDENGNQIPSFCIVTIAAAEKLEPIHNRMPVILSPEQEKTWLNPHEKNIIPLKKCLAPNIYPTNDMLQLIPDPGQ